MSRKACGCVIADARNTPAVRTGHELGGYVKTFCATHARPDPMHANTPPTDAATALRALVTTAINDAVRANCYGRSYAFCVDRIMAAIATDALATPPEDAPAMDGGDAVRGLPATWRQRSHDAHVVALRHDVGSTYKTCAYELEAAIAAAPAPAVGREALRDGYLQDGCTDSDCRLCSLPAYARKPGMTHAGISPHDHGVTPPAEAREMVGAWTLDQIEEAWGAAFPLVREGFDALRYRLAAQPQATPREPQTGTMPQGGDACEGVPQRGPAEPIPDTPAQRYLDSINAVDTRDWMRGFNDCAALAAAGPGEGAEAVFRKVVADALNPSGGTGMFRVEYVDPATTRPQSPAQPAPAVAGENNNGR